MQLAASCGKRMPPPRAAHVRPLQAVCAQPGLLGMSVKAIPGMAGELRRELAQLGLAAGAEAEARQ